MEKKFNAKLTYLKEIAQNTYEAGFNFEKEVFEFKAGQYAWINFPKLLFKDPRGSRRAFSISSSPNVKERIEIIFRGSGSGFKKTLIDKRSIGRSVEIIGPFGFMGISDSVEPNLVFVAGGVAVAPFVSMVRYASENKLKNKITLILSNPGSKTSFYTKLFEGLENKNTNFKFVSDIGRLEAPIIIKSVDDIKNNFYFVTGPRDFVIDISSKLLAIGVPKGNFVFDEYHGFLFGKAKKLINKEFGDYELTLKEFRTAVTDVADHIVITDVDGHIRYANPAAEKITGYTLEEMKGSTPRLWGGLMDKAFYEHMWKTIKTDKKTFGGELTNRRKNGEIYYALARISPVLDNGELVGFVGTEEDITKIKELDKMKDEFLSIASHELRTPLAAIDGIIAMMRDGDYGKINPEMKKGLDDVNTASERMIKLVNDLLSLSRIQAGRLKYNISKFNISTPIKEITDLFAVIFKEKKLILKTELVDVEVQADSDKIKQILNNLLDNAIKFTDKGEVKIKIKELKTTVSVFVEDTGIGIAGVDKSKLFGKFQQIGNEAGRPLGTGLGLHLSKQMAIRMGGDLWLEDSTVSKGSIFALSVPKSSSKIASIASDEINKVATLHPDQKSDKITKGN